MNQRFIPYKKSSVARARVLRRRMTLAERKLWAKVRRHQLGHHFRRQVPIGNYIVDFFCMDARIVIEVDGSQHLSDSEKEKDVRRDRFLKNQGLKVLRFSSKDVMTNIDGVLQTVFEHLSVVSTPSVSPPDRGRRVPGE